MKSRETVISMICVVMFIINLAQGYAKSELSKTVEEQDRRITEIVTHALSEKERLEVQIELWKDNCVEEREHLIEPLPTEQVVKKYMEDDSIPLFIKQAIMDGF